VRNGTRMCFVVKEPGTKFVKLESSQKSVACSEKPYFATIVTGCSPLQTLRLVKREYTNTVVHLTKKYEVTTVTSVVEAQPTYASSNEIAPVYGISYGLLVGLFNDGTFERYLTDYEFSMPSNTRVEGCSCNSFRCSNCTRPRLFFSGDTVLNISTNSFCKLQANYTVILMNKPLEGQYWLAIIGSCIVIITLGMYGSYRMFVKKQLAAKIKTD
jgi:hypothetical protein